MKLGIKVYSVFLIYITAVLSLLGVLFYFNIATFGVCVLIIIAGLIGVVIYLRTMLIKPLSDLIDAIKIINFKSEVVDFTKVDSLKMSGFTEVQAIQLRVKYLIDELTDRIDKVNHEVYKGEHDPLTGCYNRSRLDKYKSLYEVQNNFWVIFIDVNNLKRMNDEFGHEAGDSLLKRAVQGISYWKPLGDIYRMGGDEFMVVLQNKEPQEVWGRVHYWYPRVGVLNKATDGFKCVLSYGVAQGDITKSFDSVMKTADDRMYEMKIALKKRFGEPLR